MTAPRTPRHRVDPRARLYWLTVEGLVLAALVGALLGAGALWPGARAVLVWIAAGIAAPGLPYVLVMPLLRYRVHRWEAGDTAVYSRTGWWAVEWKVAPLSRVQTVESTRGPVEQWFGLSSVRVTTASSYGAIVIQGLDKDVADTLVATLTRATQQTTGDAT
ncbi:MAG TPA: PH domain-containing protein [Streptomyces sp.]|nr:PH domain-containing protein [Streptomyces sp.]